MYFPEALENTPFTQIGQRELANNQLVALITRETTDFCVVTDRYIIIAKKAFYLYS